MHAHTKHKTIFHTVTRVHKFSMNPLRTKSAHWTVLGMQCHNKNVLFATFYSSLKPGK